MGGWWRRGPALRRTVARVDGEVGHARGLPRRELQLAQLTPTTTIARLHKYNYEKKDYVHYDYALQGCLKNT